MVPLLATIPGVAQSQLIGERKYAIRIQLDPLRMAALARSNLCTANTVAGNYQTAMPDCEGAVKILAGLPSKGDVARLRLLTRLRWGNALSRDQQTGAAGEQYRTVAQDLDPLDAGLSPIAAELVEALRPFGNDALGLALRKQGVLMSRAGQRDQALERFEEALRVGGGEAPAMRDVVAFSEAAAGQAEAMEQFRGGQARLAIETSRKAIARLGQNASSGAKLLRAEIEANMRSFEAALAPPSR